MKIAVVGTGYVGLVTGTCFAEAGNEVSCVDIDANKVNQMKNGQVPIYEPGLEDIFARNVREGRLTFTTDLKEGILGATAVFLALPTPPEEDGSADLSYILGVAENLGGLLLEYTVVVNKSTVPVGTSEKVRDKINKNSRVDFDVVSNPEFLREGRAVDDFQRPDRVVIGTSSQKAKKVMERLYAPFVKSGKPIIIMDEKSAELTKYGANALLATKITFMNELANLAELVGADVDMIREGIGTDPRIGNQFLYSGIGYGGSCFPKDVVALSHTSNEYGYNFKIIDAVSEANSLQKKRLVEKVMDYYGGDITGKKFALWGLAFKPDTDDIREAPSIEIIKGITEAGASIVAFDPEAMNNVKRQFGSNELLSFAEGKDARYACLEDADALLIATEWSEFRTPDFNKMKSLLKHPVIFDGRNIFNMPDMRDQGFYYESIGRSPVTQDKDKQNDN